MKVVVFDADQECHNLFDAALPGQTIVYVKEPVSATVLAEHADAEIVSVFVTSALNKENIDALPNLKCIAARSTGVDNIDVVHAREKGVAVVNVPKYGARTVAEFTFALILTLSRRIFDAFYQVREEGNFKTESLEGFELFGKTLGVIGTGAIGRTVVGIAQGFGMKVLMFDKFPDHKLENEVAKYVSLDELLAGSDIVTLHVPYMPENHHLLGSDAFGKIKHGAFIINTARGELIDTEALVEAIKSGTVAGAGLDVLEKERELKDEMELVRGIESIHELKVLIHNHVLISTPRVVVTPHIAFFSREAYNEILSTSASNVKNFLAGTPTNTV